MVKKGSQSNSTRSQVTAFFCRDKTEEMILPASLTHINTHMVLLSVWLSSFWMSSLLDKEMPGSTVGAWEPKKEGLTYKCKHY